MIKREQIYDGAIEDVISAILNGMDWSQSIDSESYLYKNKCDDIDNPKLNTPSKVIVLPSDAEEQISRYPVRLRDVLGRPDIEDNETEQPDLGRYGLPKYVLENNEYHWPEFSWPRFDSGDSNDILGAYFKMNPRGRIELYAGPLTWCFWDLIFGLNKEFNITRSQLRNLAKIWVNKTLVHERFHHLIDVLMVLFGTHKFKNRLVEEALAVAMSYHVNTYDEYGVEKEFRKVNDPVTKEFLNRAYAYTAPGYRDWRIYSRSHVGLETRIYVIHPRAQLILGDSQDNNFYPYDFIETLIGFDSENFDLSRTDGVDVFLVHS